MGDPHGDPQTSPQHAHFTWTWCPFKKTIQEIHVDRRVVDWSAGRHVDHPCGGKFSPWPARKVTETFSGIFGDFSEGRKTATLVNVGSGCKVGRRVPQKLIT